MFFTKIFDVIPKLKDSCCHVPFRKPVYFRMKKDNIALSIFSSHSSLKIHVFEALPLM